MIAVAVASEALIKSLDDNKAKLAKLADPRTIGFGGGRFGGNATGRETGRGTADDPDVVQGRPALEPKFQLPPRVTVQPWQAAPVTDEQLRNPINIIPPELRPRVAMRYADGSYFLVFNTILNWDNLGVGRKVDPK
jgi:hypothetical protein